MSRRTDVAASRAAEQATEAARVLAQRSHEAKAEKAEAAPPAEEPSYGDMTLEKAEKLKANRAHVKVMEDIAKKRGLEPEPEPEPEKPAEPAKAETPPVEAAPAAEQPPATPETPAEPKVVRVKVDGEEFDAPAEEVEAAGGVRQYQIQRAAENRLKKANEALAESKRIADLILRQQQQSPKEPEKPKESDAEFIAARMDTIRFGTPQEAAAAQLEIQQRLTPKPVDANEIVEQAARRIKHDAAVAAFDREFQDIVTNPIRLKAVVALRQERLDRHRIENPNQPIDWDRFYRTIGTEVRSAFGGSSQPAATPEATPGTPSQPSEKEARKASIVNLPAAAARAEGPKEEKPLTPEEERREAIADLRRKRGQAAG